MALIARTTAAIGFLFPQGVCAQVIVYNPDLSGQRINEDRIVNLLPRGVVKLSNGADKNA